MARHKLTLEHRIKGAKKALANPKTPKGLRGYLEKFLRQHGHSAALLFILMLSTIAHGQQEQFKYARQFYQGGINSTVGAMDTAAQNSCDANTAIPCIIVNDSVLALYPTGVIPTPCAQCTFIDYRTIGQVQFANAANPTLSNAFGTTFPLKGTLNNSCVAGNINFGNANDATNTSGFTGSSTQSWICVNSVRIFFFGSTSTAMGSGRALCWPSTADAGGAGCDTGLSRGAPNEVDCGNGTAADKTCTFKAANITLTGTCTGCGTGSVAQLWTFCGGTVGTLNATEYSLGPANGVNSWNCPTAATTALEVPVSHAGTLKNLRAIARVAGGTAGSGVIKVYVNGSAAAGITCTLGTGLTCNDTTHTAAVVAGDTWKVTVLTNQVSDTTADIRVGMDFQ